MILVSALMGAIGLTCILFRKTLLGIYVGLQLITIGATLLFVQAGAAAMGKAVAEAQVFGVFITLAGLGQLIAGYAIAVRLFYQRGRTHLDDVRALKH